VNWDLFFGCLALIAVTSSLIQIAVDKTRRSAEFAKGMTGKQLAGLALKGTVGLAIDATFLSAAIVLIVRGWPN